MGRKRADQSQASKDLFIQSSFSQNARELKVMLGREADAIAKEMVSRFIETDRDSRRRRAGAVAEKKTLLPLEMSEKELAAKIRRMDFSLDSAFYIGMLKLSKTARLAVRPSPELEKFLRRLNVRTAREMLNSDLLFSYRSRRFKAEKREISVDKVNTVANASLFFDDIGFDEMREFLEFLAQKNLIGLSHPVGKKIMDKAMMLSESSLLRVPKGTLFYRGRRHEAGHRPFLEPEMRKAPYGVTGQGRFSSAGIPAFYASEHIDGVVSEVKSHTRGRNYEIQIAVFESKNDFRLVDTRGWKNALAKYIMFPSQDKPHLNPDYLVSNFFAQCLMQVGVEGLVYRSTTNKYDNYVFWDDQGFRYLPHMTTTVSK